MAADDGKPGGDRSELIRSCGRLSRCIEETTRKTPAVWPAHTASDIRYPLLYAHAPTVGFGPRAGNFGGPDEWLDVDDFARAVQSLMLLIARWCDLVPVS